jgi:hypothetical protein
MATRSGGRPRAKGRARAPRRRVKDPGAAFCSEVEAALKRGAPGAISDAVVRRVLTAAVKIYAAKAEDAETEIPPFDRNDVTATEAVTAVCAMIRAVDLNLFDVAMWFRRPLSGAIADLERRG